MKLALTIARIWIAFQELHRPPTHTVPKMVTVIASGHHPPPERAGCSFVTEPRG
ncbi:MAG: hypothetical protein ACI80K_000027 [Paracoccaceae bacterium]|jgi:hypothetical protein